MNNFYKINSIFPTIQGEGSRKGIPSVFIRLGECNLRNTCFVKGGCDTEFDYFYITETDCIINKLKKYASITDVVITGGEPTLQFLNPLFSRLHRLGYFITIETNGILYPNSAIEYVNLYSCSPKYSNFKTKFNKRVIKNIIATIQKEKPTQLKFVVDTENDIEISKEILSTIVEKVGFPYEMNNTWGVFYQPHETKTKYSKESLIKYNRLINTYINDPVLNRMEIHWNLQDHKILDMD